MTGCRPAPRTRARGRALVATTPAAVLAGRRVLTARVAHRPAPAVRAGAARDERDQAEGAERRREPGRSRASVGSVRGRHRWSPSLTGDRPPVGASLSLRPRREAGQPYDRE